jgi:hypothetical protein
MIVAHIENSVYNNSKSFLFNSKKLSVLKSNTDNKVNERSGSLELYNVKPCVQKHQAICTK